MSTRSLPRHLALLGLTTIALSLCACGPRFKTPNMLEYERQKSTPELTRLKLDCPDLINDSLKYYERAKELHEDNEPKESEHFVTMASITWRIAERRSAFLNHRKKMADAKVRYDRAQLLLADTQRRKEALLNMKANRAQRAELAMAESAAQAAKRKALEEELKVLIEQALKAKAEADSYNAQETAAALYNKGVAALKGIDSSARAGQVSAAASIAQGAVKDFQAAITAAKPAFERAEAKRNAKQKMDQLLSDAQRLSSATASMEGRGVVLSLKGLYRKGKLVRAKQSLLERVADLINKYPGLRIMIEAHTSKNKKRSVALGITEEMAQEVLTILKPQINDPETKMNTLGRGDYAPVSSNPRSPANERIDIVFFNPRID